MESERNEDLSLDFEDSGERNLRYRHTSRTCAKKEEGGIYSKILYKLISSLTSVLYYKELFCSVATIGLDKALKWIWTNFRWFFQFPRKRRRWAFTTLQAWDPLTPHLMFFLWNKELSKAP